MQTEKIIVWADGAEQEAIELTVPAMSYDVEAAAAALGCEVDAVNCCSPGEMTSYGVSLKTEIFQAPKV